MNAYRCVEHGIFFFSGAVFAGLLISSNVGALFILVVAMAASYDFSKNDFRVEP